MDRFSRFNPKVTLLFFLFQIIITIVIFNPAVIAFSLAGALAYKIKLKGRQGISLIYKLVIPLLLVVTLFNFIFSHRGASVLFTLFEMNYTLESLVYGICQGGILTAVTVWFSCFGDVLTAERLLSVFGKFLPNTAMIFSMVLSFIPRLSRNAKEISESRQLVDEGESRLKKGINNLSALVTMTVEDSIVTADSMKARGYGKGRTVYSKYKFSSSDFIILIITLLLFAVLIFAKAAGNFYFSYDPIIKIAPFSFWADISVALLSFLPVIIDFEEDIRWYFLKRKI